MNEEILEVLKMVKEGTVTPEQGVELIEALIPSAPREPAAASARPAFRNLGSMILTAEFLRSLDNGTSYLNMGRTVIASDVQPDLLARKIGKYRNMGQTVAPARLLAVLVSRCHGDNLGTFTETPESEGGQAAAQESS